MSTQRVALWDNARFGAIALMVAGHTLTKMVGENDAAFTLYAFIYALGKNLIIEDQNGISKQEDE